MKSKVKTFILALCLGGMTALLSCGDDDPGPGSSDFCNFDLCASNDVAKKACEIEYKDCMQAGILTESECRTQAKNSCN